MNPVHRQHILDEPTIQIRMNEPHEPKAVLVFQMVGAFALGFGAVVALLLLWSIIFN